MGSLGKNLALRKKTKKKKKKSLIKHLLVDFVRKSVHQETGSVGLGYIAPQEKPSLVKMGGQANAVATTNL